jgi:hypothetical protein
MAASRRIMIILRRLRYGARKIMFSDPKAYRFRPVSLANLPRLRAWLQTRRRSCVGGAILQSSWN